MTEPETTPETSQENKPVISEDVKARLKDQNIWIFFLQIIMYGIAFWISSMILCFVTLLHFILRLLTGEPNAELKKFAQSLSTFLYQIVQFINFNSDKTPFPLSSWPSGPPKTHQAETANVNPAEAE